MATTCDMELGARGLGFRGRGIQSTVCCMIKWMHQISVQLLGSPGRDLCYVLG